MPNIKSAEKRVRASEAKTLRNKMLKSTLRTYLKRYDTAVAAQDKDAAKTLYPVVIRKVDQAMQKGILHRNAAAHKKSQLTRKLTALGA